MLILQNEVADSLVLVFSFGSRQYRVMRKKYHIGVFVAYRALILFGFIFHLGAWVGHSAPIISISTSQQTITGPDFTTGNGVNYDFKVGNQGGLLLDSFTISAGTYDVLDLPFKVTLQRSQANTKATLNYFLTNNSNSPVNPIGSRVYTMEEAYNTRDLSAGVENMFQNNDSAFQKHVERVDYVYSAGLTLGATDDAADYGFAFFERDGNNKFHVAAVTGIDGNNNVTSVGSIVSFGDGGTYAYGADNLTGFDDTARLVGTIADPNQTHNSIITGQDLGGVFISLANLGVASGDTVYGYVLLGGDQSSLPTNINNFGAYNLNTGATDGGGDLYGGGMIFQLRGAPPPGGGTLLNIENYYWDVNGTNVGAVNTAALATENAALSDLWSKDSVNDNWGSRLGGVVTNSWADNKRAVFSAGGDEADPNETGSADGNTYTITVKSNETVKAAGLRFEEGTVTINNGNANSRIELNRVKGETPEIDVQDGLTATINATIIGTEGFDFRDNKTNNGNSRLVLRGNNTISGTATIEEGTLELAGTGTNQSLGSINTINIEGGTLLLSATDEINNSGNILLNGGNIRVSNNFDHSETVGTLTLNENSTIDMGTRGGTDKSIINFADSSSIAWSAGKQWSIVNWSGIGSLNGTIGVKDPLATGGGGSDRLIFGGDIDGLTLTQLAQIKFINPDGYAPGVYDAIILSTGEIVPVVPEAETWVALMVLALLGGWKAWQRWHARSVAPQRV